MTLLRIVQSLNREDAFLNEDGREILSKLLREIYTQQSEELKDIE